MPEKTDPRNIVIMRTDRIGEVLLSTVAVDALRRAFPGARISFVTSEYSRPVVEGRDDIDEVVTVDTMTRGGTLVRAVRLASTLKEKKFDAAIVLNPHKVLHMAAFLAGIGVRLGYDRKWGCLLNRKMRDLRSEGRKHEIEYTMDLLRLLGVEGEAFGPRLPVDEAARERVREFLSRRGIAPDTRVIVVHPGSSNPAKIWPSGRYALLIRRIRMELGFLVCVLGVKEERSLANRIVQEAGADVLNLAGEFDLKEVSALLERACLFIGNDTGPMHMAAALGVPVVAIFSRNIPGVSPARWRPWGEGHVVFHETPGCEPCHDTGCPYEYKCMQAVAVDDVFKAAQRILNV